ncbi:MAG: thioredoxin family protein [Bdellovibrionales bacterium]
MKSLALVFALALSPCVSWSEALPGEAAPNFEVKDANGKVQKLADYKGKWLVLEWFNKDCPYVKKHYGSQNMQRLQKEFTDKKVAWLTVISSAPGKQGHVSAKQALADMKERDAKPTATLLDESGAMGKTYGAQTTPHMFVINPEQRVAYAGAIDDNDSADPGVIAKSKNYVSAALTAGLAGKPIEKNSARPYGCSVKYQ